MKFLISSSESYKQITLPIILKSLIGSGVPEYDIIVSVNSNSFKFEYKEKITYLYYNTNIFEYVSLKTALNLDEDIFLLHDTCEVTNNFYTNVINFDYKNYDCVRITREDGYTSSNLGVYTNKLLNTFRDKINSIDNLQKVDAIILENTFFAGKIGSFGGKEQLLGVKKIYNGNERLIEYFEYPGIFKYKANYGSNNGPNGYFLNV